MRCAGLRGPQLGASVEELVDHFRSGSRACLAEVKSVMCDGHDPDLSSAAHLETERFMAYLDRSRDATEGFTAYREARPPAMVKLS